MRYIRISEDSTRPELEAAIRHLRGKQSAQACAEIRETITSDIDELLDMLALRIDMDAMIETEGRPLEGVTGADDV